MTLHSQQVLINAANPVLLYPADADGVELTISASANIYVGNSNTSGSTGFLLAAGSHLGLSLGPGELVYGLAVTGRETVYILATKND